MTVAELVAKVIIAMKKNLPSESEYWQKWFYNHNKILYNVCINLESLYI